MSVANNFSYFVICLLISLMFLLPCKSFFFPEFYIITVINLSLLLSFVLFRKVTTSSHDYKGIHIFSPLELVSFVIYVKIVDLFENYSNVCMVEEQICVCLFSYGSPVTQASFIKNRLYLDQLS